MGTLTGIEFSKIRKMGAAKFAIITVLVVMAILIGIEAVDVAEYNNNAAYRDELFSWQEREENVIKYASISLEEDSFFTELQREQIRRRIAIAEYRLEHNIQKDVYKNVWWFFNDSTFANVIKYVTAITAIIACFHIAGEYNRNTMRQMLLLPYKRYKILLAKLAAISLFGLLLYMIVFVLGLVSGFILHGTNGLGARVVLYYGSSITTMNMSLYSLLVVLLNVVELVFYISIVILLCVLTKNTTISAIVSLLLVLFGAPACFFLATYYPVLYYMPFANLDFRRYLDFGTIMPAIESGFNSVVIENLNPFGSAAIVVVTILTVLAVSFTVFKRQDI